MIFWQQQQKYFYCPFKIVRNVSQLTLKTEK